MFYKMNELMGPAFTNAIVRIMTVNKKYDPNNDNDILLEGVTSSDFTVGGSTEFDAPMSETSRNVASWMNYFKTAVSGAMGGQDKKDLGGQLSTSISETVNFYKGNQKPRFSIDVAFITLDASDIGNRAIDHVEQVMKAVYPTTIEGGVLQAPLNYRVDITKKAKGLKLSEYELTPVNTVVVEIGDYISMTCQVITEANFTLSKQTVRGGTPLFATGTISFEPAKMISYRELLGYFGHNNNSAYANSNVINDAVSNTLSKIPNPFGGMF